MAISSPAPAGPRIRAAWIRTLFRPTAFTTRSEPTISITNACRVGWSTAVTRPRARTSPNTIQGTTAPVAVSAQRPSAGTAIVAWVATSRRRFGQRSASTPPQAPTSNMGRN